MLFLLFAFGDFPVPPHLNFFIVRAELFLVNKL